MSDYDRYIDWPLYGRDLRAGHRVFIGGKYQRVDEATREADATSRVRCGEDWFDVVASERYRVFGLDVGVR